MKTRQLTKEELIKKIKALEEIYAKNLKLKMYEACNSNMELIHNLLLETMINTTKKELKS